MEKVNKYNFIQKMENEMLSRLLCTEIKSTYLKLNCFIEKINLIWIQPILDTYFFQIKIINTIINLNMTDDHFLLEGSLNNFEIQDLSNYPFTIKCPDEYKKTKIKMKNLLTSNQNNSLTYEYKSMNKWCPYCIENYTSEAYVNINSSNLYYVQENFLRFFNYLMGEFLGSFGPSLEVVEYRLKKNQIVIVDPIDIEFLRLYVIINNPKIILKARPQFDEGFIVDLGTVIITSAYSKVFNKIRENPKEFRWQVTYKFELNNFNIITNDEFYLLNPTNAIANMHFTYLTENDNKKSDLEVDKAFQIDVLLDVIDINLRQCDFVNILKLNDLNISYFDYLDQYFDYFGYREKSNINKNVLNTNLLNPKNKNKKKNLKEEIINSNDEQLRDKYIDIIFNLLVKSININLFLLNNKSKKEFIIFSKLSLRNLQLDFYRKLNTNKDISILIESPKIFEYKNIENDFKIITPINEFPIIFSYPNLKENFNDDKKIDNNTSTNNYNNFIENVQYKINEKISDKEIWEFDYEILYYNFSKFMIHKSQLCKSKNKEISIKIFIDKEREKSYVINISNVIMIFKIDTILLIKQFFMEGFPYYSNLDKDIPNLYEENEENYPGMRLFLEIKNPMISILSDNTNVKNQDALCLSTDLVLGLKIEKICKIKAEVQEAHNTLDSLIKMVDDKDEKEKLIKNLNEDKGLIYSMNLTLFDVCPFIINYSELLNASPNSIKKKRKIINNFMLIYEYQTFIKLIPQENFILFHESKIEINKLCLKASYRDLVLILKCSQYNKNLFNTNYEEKIEDLMYYSRLKREFEKNKDDELNKIEKKISIQKFLDDKVINKEYSDYKNYREEIIITSQSVGLPNLKISNFNNPLVEIKISDIINFEQEIYKYKNISNPLNEINCYYYINSHIIQNKNKSFEDLINNTNAIFESDFDNIKAAEKDSQIQAPPLLKINSLDFTENIDENIYFQNKLINKNIKKTAFKKYNEKNYIIIDKGIKNQKFISKGIDIVLIDDQDRQYHPFLSTDIQNLNITSVCLNFNQNQTTYSLNLKIHIYNYLAAIWEPLLERAFIEIDVTSSKLEGDFSVKSIEIKFPFNEKKNNSALDFNVSDLTVKNFYHFLVIKIKNNIIII